MSSINCILYPPTLEYHYLIQRPQHLMRSFSELGIPVFFLNNSSTYSRKPNGISKLNDLFYLVNNVDPMPYINGAKPVVYYTNAAHVDLVHQYNPSLVVFDSVDEPSEEFASWRPNYYRAVASADIVLAASDKLYQMALRLNNNVHLVPNACDYEYFSGNSDKYDYLAVDDDILTINKPIIGYIGAIASWCDLNLIAEIADNFPYYNVVMIGPYYNISKVPHRRNIHWLGFKPYEQLAAYARYFDVAIIPFKKTSMTESVNPIKMWEYLATGMPIVSTALPEARKYSDLIYCSEDHREFLINIKKALEEDSIEKREQRKDIASRNSWLERARTIMEIIENEMRLRNLPEFSPPIKAYDEILAKTSWSQPAYYPDYSPRTFGFNRVRVGNSTQISTRRLQRMNPYNHHVKTVTSRPLTNKKRPVSGSVNSMITMRKAVRI